MAHFLLFPKLFKHCIRLASLAPRVRFTGNILVRHLFISVYNSIRHLIFMHLLRVGGFFPLNTKNVLNSLSTVIVLMHIKDFLCWCIIFICGTIKAYGALHSQRERKQ